MDRSKVSLWSLAGTLVSSLPAVANSAAPGHASASASAPEPRAAEPTDAEPFIRRHAPRRNSWQLGLSGGVFLPSRGVDLRDEGQPFRRFDRVAGDLAFRAGYSPLRFLGVELEGTVMPGASTTGGEGVTFWSFRGQAIVRLPFWRIVPFASLGGGALGVASGAAAVGNDTDGMMTWGGGLEFHVTRHVGLRLDVRTNLSEKPADPDLADSEEILLGLLVRLGPKPKPKPKVAPELERGPDDGDGDGVVDPDDACPETPGLAPRGCPLEDTDGDTVMDPDDACPKEPGEPPGGCPPEDGDGDGVRDRDDACPDEPGPAPTGCPTGDRDADGILDDVDSCPDEPETDNGFQDDDGCPDVPPEIEQFSGVIEGVFFDLDRATIREPSIARLAEVVDVLQKHPKIRIEVSGHSDSTGSREHNMELSRRRAEAVRDHLVGQGVDATRIETRGAGPDEPIDSNATKEGRAKNRRIEFRVL